MKSIVLEGRKRWMIGADLGLSQSYLFIGGEIVTVPDEDAAILLDPAKAGDHVFVLAESDEAAAVLAEAEGRAAAKAAGWKSPGKCCDDDVVGEVDEGESIAPGSDGASTAGDPDVMTTTTAEPLLKSKPPLNPYRRSGDSMTTPAGVALVVCMCGRTVTEVASADACSCAPRITLPCEQCRNLVVRFGYERTIATARVLVMQTYDLVTCKVDEAATQVILDFEPGNRGADRGGEPQDPSILKRALAARRAAAQAKEASLVRQ